MSKRRIVFLVSETRKADAEMAKKMLKDMTSDEIRAQIRGYEHITMTRGGELKRWAQTSIDILCAELGRRGED